MRNIILSIIVITLLLLSCKKEILYTLNVSVTPSGSGTTSITSGTYQAGQSVSITATPAPEYIFKGWSGSSNSDNNPLTLVMDSSKSLIANFEKRQYPLSLTIEGSGVVKEEIVLTQAKVGSYPSGTTVKLTAIPDTGSIFEGWSGDTTLSTNPITINFKKAYNITAKFVEKIKFTTNLDTGIYNVTDTLPLKISVTSKVPTGGLLYSITSIWEDSSKLIYKIDSSSNSSSLSLNIPGHFKPGNYSISITVVSKSNTINKLNKSIKFINEPLRRFTGYKVDINALRNSRQKDNGKEYWTNTQVLSDLVVGKFQKPYGNRGSYGTFYGALANGDFNNDGYVDVFNGGALFKGIQALPTFLIWNQNIKKFEEQNLFNQPIQDLGNPPKVVPIYLNNDDYVDLVVFCYVDEGLTDPPLKKVALLVSDGKGKYNTIEITTESPIFYHNGGDVGDLNGDKIPDLVVNGGGLMSILWGTTSAPYFDESKPAYFCSITYGSSSGEYYPYKNDNGFGESCPEIVQRHVWNSYITDINKDGWNDIIFSSGEDTSKNGYNYQRLVLNLGNGRFNKSSIVPLPSNAHNTNNNDYIVDDINSDGKNDIIAVVESSGGVWYLMAYFQNSNGSFAIDKNIFIASAQRPFYRDAKPQIIYFDFNDDGEKDIAYIDGANNGQEVYKTVFIRKGNQFIEEDFFQYDYYMKSLYK